MTILLSLVLPGLGQMLRGDRAKAGTMFATALLTGLLTGGVGWLACGVWSAIDQRATPSPAIPSSASRAGTNPGAGSGSGAAGPASSLGWAFRFAVLAVAAAIVFHNVGSGNLLQSLELFGVKMQFTSSLAGRADQPAAGTEAATSAPLPLPGGAGGAGGAFQTDPSAASPPPSAAQVATAALAEVPLPLSVGGSWVDSRGATYEITQSGADVHIREISRIIYMPVETATCVGTATGQQVVALCATYLGSNGQVVLTLADGGALVGEYRDFTTGSVVPMMLTR